MVIDEKLICMLVQNFTLPDILMYHGRGRKYLRLRMREYYMMCNIPTDDRRDYSLSRYQLNRALAKMYPWASERKVEIFAVEDSEVEQMVLSGMTPEEISMTLGVSLLQARARISNVYRAHGLSNRRGGLCRRELIATTKASTE